MTSTTPLSYEDWSALEAAEAPLYDGPGTHAYTDVTPRSESAPIAELWERAAENVENSGEDYDEHEAREETARRVAYALAIIAFGPEFVGVNQEGR